MTHHGHDQLITWLNNAYAMEQSIAKVLENHVKDAKDHPQMQTRLQQHLDATKRHAELVKGCIERLGGQTSALKSGMANVMGTVQGMSTGAAKDELVKNALHDYGTEHFEIASYTSLIAAAQDAGDQETARICREILMDEEGMANWLIEQIPLVTLEQMQREPAGATR